MDINSQHHNLLGNQILSISEDFCIWQPFWIQNGCHSKPKWSPYGAGRTPPCKYPFPLKSFHFWIFNNLLLFSLSGGHFETFKNKEHNFWVMIYFCDKFKMDLLYGFRLTFFAPWLPWQRPPFWNFSTPPPPQNLPHVDIPTKFHEVWWKESKHFLIPLFCFHGNCGEVCPTDSDFFALFRSLDVDVVPYKFHQILFGE